MDTVVLTGRIVSVYIGLWWYWSDCVGIVAVWKSLGLSVEWTGVPIHQLPFQQLGYFVHPTKLVLCLSEETLKAMEKPGEDPTQGKRVPCCGLKEWWSLSLTN